MDGWGPHSLEFWSCLLYLIQKTFEFFYYGRSPTFGEICMRVDVAMLLWTRHENPDRDESVESE
jgi:hypothetical protein